MAVSSALLFLSIASAPHHAGSELVAESSSTSESLLLSEIYPCALRDDEYVMLTNAGSIPVDLSNWSISDGEGSLLFAKGLWLGLGRSFVISMNSSSFESAYGRAPDWSPEHPNSSAVILSSGRFRLADSGDSLVLIDGGGMERDFVVYGNCSETSKGWTGPAVPSVRSGEVLKRTDDNLALQDTNTRSDWLPFREFRYGYTQVWPYEVKLPAGAVVAFVSPDCSLRVVLDTILSSTSHIRLCTYELDSALVCEALLDALGRGVAVQLLVDGAPVGGISSRELSCISALRAAGADVRIVNGNLTCGVVQHVGALHAKYMVVDSSRGVVMSENFVEDGVPSDTLCGNRGWGLRIDSSEVAFRLESLFESDSRPSRPDVRDWADDSRFDATAAVPPPILANHTVAAMPPLVSTCEARVTLVASPDGSLIRPFIVEWIARARSIVAEQFQADLLWETRWSDSEATSPLVGALEDALRKGTRMRVLFDSSWFNLVRNGAVADQLNELVTEIGAPSSIRMLDSRNPITLLHNKGAIFDGRVSMVSSNNWVYSSYAKNRELAAFIESDEIARYFARAFEFDWEPDVTPPDASAGEDIHVAVGQKVLLTAEDSVDDRSVVHWLWDLSADGTYEGDREEFEFYPTEPGVVRVDLVVEDGWGNRAFDSITITVDDPDGGTGPLDCLSGPSVFVILGCAGAGVAAGCAIARRRLCHPSKLNQLKPD